ncbi:MAG TPA: VCBS repeat-containing protein [Pirellulales bacterium]|nr:VCBS repeat-containing protein [Pirellulales bacterium]
MRLFVIVCAFCALGANPGGERSGSESSGSESSSSPRTAKHAETFDGWQGLRVIHQEGLPQRIKAADLDGTGRQQLIVVNARQSRLDLYSWQPPGKHTAAPAPDRDRPNDLPMAPDWKHSEVPLDELPSDVAVYDLDGDQRPELLVLAATGNKVIAYERDGEGGWRKGSHWDLLPGTPTGKTLLLLRHLNKGRAQLLLSFEQGIQTLDLEKGSRPSWLSPRESRGRLDWKLVDLDGDGDEDLLEWSSQPRQTVRWFENAAGNLLPAQVLYDRTVQEAGAIVLKKLPAEVLLLGGTHDGLLRRYAMAPGDANELGRHESLPMPSGAKTAWCGVQLDGRPSLVASDPNQPRLRVHELSKTGWLGEQSFPSLGGIRNLVAPQAQPGSVLLWIKDAADLYVSTWRSGRLTYPEVMRPDASSSAATSKTHETAYALPVASGGETGRKILTLDSVGSTIWWVQQVGSDLDLHVWPKAAKTATTTRFKNIGTKTEKVLWLGGERLLVQDAYASGARLAAVQKGKTTLTDPPHMSKVDLGEFALYDVDGQLKPARLTDGVLQWLSADLRPTDQIMLPDGQRIGAYVPLAGGRAWALEQGGGFLDKLEPDDAGVARVTDRLRLPHGAFLTLDPVLGLMLVDQDRVIRLSRGQSMELKLIDSIDGRVGRPSGVKEATIHRFLVADVTGDGDEDVVLCDDKRHQLTVLVRGDKELKPIVSWQVFEDQAYPYGGEHESQVTEPRAIVGCDADGDGRPDLALLCQDRLLIYLAADSGQLAKGIGTLTRGAGPLKKDAGP